MALALPLVPSSRRVLNVAVRFLVRRLTILGSIVAASIATDARIASTQEPSAQDEKILGHWGEDTIGFRWTEDDSVDGRWQQTDIGPFLATSVALGDRTVLKGRVVSVGDAGDRLCYDTDSGRLEAWWRGDSLVRFDPARYGLIRHPEPSGAVLWRSPVVAPANAVDYRHRTMLRRGREIVLQGTIGAMTWSEGPSLVTDGDQVVLVRDVELGPSESDVRFDPGLPVFDAARLERRGNWRLASFGQEGSAGVIALSPGDATEESERAIERFLTDGVWSGSDRTRAIRIAIVLARSEDQASTTAPAIDEVAVGLERLPAFDRQRGTDPTGVLWPELLVTRGTIGSPQRGLRMDTIGLPVENPWRALMFLSGIDFFDAGTAAVCTVHGDVWIVSGIDDSLGEIRWKRYATGLFQSLGLKIVDGRVYVLGRDQLTRLEDRNGDGEADEYVCVSDAAPTSFGVHDYAACLETDSRGRFLSVRANTGVERIAADGSTYEVIATGLRNPNGMGIADGDLITVAPQEGEWTPASAIYVVREGDHYGYLGPQVNETRPLGYDPPMLWLPRLLDNSSGGQVMIPEQGWGGLGGKLLHLSFGRCWPLVVYPERTADGWQGAAVRLPFECDSGICRGRVRPGTSEIFLAGLKGWASSSVQDGCLHRLVPTGEPTTVPIRCTTMADGLLLEFDLPLDPTTTVEVGRWSAQQWNYRYSAEYGSADYRPSQPSRPGHDELRIRDVTLSPDGRSVFVRMPEIAPVMQVALTYDLTTADGQPIADTLYGTIRRLGDERGPADPTPEVPSIDAGDRATARGLLLRMADARLDGTLTSDVRVARTASLSRVGEPLSPWIEGRGLVATFEGWLEVPRRFAGRFEVRGDVNVELSIDDRPVPVSVEGESGVEFAPVELGRGRHAIRLIWSVLGEDPVEIELLERPDSGDAVPISADRWFHDPTDPRLAQPNERRSARERFAQLGCIACHPLDPSIAGAPHRMPELDRQAPDLDRIGERVRATWLTDWILDPYRLDPTSEMPRLLDPSNPDDRRIAADIAAYLIGRDSETAAGADRTLLDAASVDGVDPESIALGESLVETIGCVACHLPEPRDGDNRRVWNRTALRFERTQLIAFLADPTAHHPASRMPRIATSDEERQALASYLLSLPTDAEAVGDALRSSQQGDPERGGVAFRTLGCAQCHPSSTVPADRPSLPIAQVRTDRGCLAVRAEEGVRTQVSGTRIADYDLDSVERERLARWIATDLGSLARDGRTEAAERFIARADCRACHDRDGETGRLAEILFDESIQGLSPEWLPSLTHAGEKLEPEWTERFLAGADRRSLRPWLRARMPSFPEAARTIARGLADAPLALAAERQERERIDAELAAVGGRLIGAVEGFDCRQCHALGGVPATGDQGTQVSLGIDFAEAGARLRPGYYRRWMRDPTSIDPLTKMPRYSEDGRTTKVPLLEGQAEAQFEAILQFLREAGATKAAAER
ncbi:MAG TPA: hypothetical protein PLI18_04105 [Pirellulaceae bacterium]|nr:hypothetical protein [Pirellulaceae bacterium]